MCIKATSLQIISTESTSENVKGNSSQGMYIKARHLFIAFVRVYITIYTHVCMLF